MTRYMSAVLLVVVPCFLTINTAVCEQGPTNQTDQDKIENYGINRQKLFKEIEEREKTKTYTYVVNGVPIYIEQRGNDIVTSNKQSYLIVLDESALLKKTKEYEKNISEVDSKIHVIVIKPSHWFAQKINDNKNNCYLITKDGVEKFQADNVQKIIDFLKKKRDRKVQISVLKFLWDNSTTIVLVVQTVVLLVLMFFVSRK